MTGNDILIRLREGEAIYLCDLPPELLKTFGDALSPLVASKVVGVTPASKLVLLEGQR